MAWLVKTVRTIWRQFMGDRQRYFAYGSNMCLRRLQARVPSARALAIGSIDLYELRFHKRSTKDGSAKCNAFRTGNKEDVVWGVVFEYDIREKPNLDRAEGGYDEGQLDVRADSGVINALWYLASAGSIREGLKPYQWYKDFVLAGAIEHDLPAQYIEMIRRVPAREDPNPERAASERKLLPEWYGAP